MPHQPRLIKDEPAVYEMDAVTKDAYNERLREKLQDPEFRRIEGFPIGEDEAILALSDPPFYTSCPNQFVPEIMEQWRIDRGEIRKSLVQIEI